MKKIMFVIVLVLLVVILAGCTPTATEEKPKQVSRFVQVERTGVYSVVCDKETKVMYAVSYHGAGMGVFTLLVNADGSPQLWEE